MLPNFRYSFRHLPVLNGALVGMAMVGCASVEMEPTAVVARPAETLYLEPQGGEIQKAWPQVDTSRFPKVSRWEIIQMAEAYRNHEWLGRPENVFHGVDADGVRVDTPDDAFHSENPDVYPGWWVPGMQNKGIPYQWGGFSSLAEFDAGIRAGKFGGDISTPTKRRLLDAAVSRHAVGIDCSGFISRCWKLPRSYSTRELPGLCTPILNWDSLQAGDILNTRNEHVMLFEGWVSADRMSVVVYETGCPPTWKVFRRGLKRLPLLQYGYQAFRYRNVVD